MKLKAETEKKFFSEGEKSMKKKLTKKELIENHIDRLGFKTKI